MTTTSADDRWDGAHGIGRYAREVLARLTVPWRPLGLSGSPTAPVDALQRVPAGATIYSPGYNAFIRARRQLLTLHDLIHLHTDWPGRARYLAYYRLVVRPVVRRTGAVMTVSETSRAEIREWLGDDDVRVIDGSIGCSAEFTPDARPTEAADPFLMYVGNLRAHKNVEVLLDALVSVPDARMTAVLPQAEHEAARSLIAARGITDRVDLLSGVDDATLARHYRGAAATVMPSLREGFGLPALESVMTGTPVLYWAGCAAVAETVGERGTAVAESSNPEAWAVEIRRALASPRRVEPPAGKYRWEHTAAAVDEALRSLT